MSCRPPSIGRLDGWLEYPSQPATLFVMHQKRCPSPYTSVKYVNEAIVEAIKGNASAIGYIAYAMDVGALGRRNKELAFCLYQISAKKGDSTAQYNLAQWYFENSNKKNRNSAGLYWLRQSAAKSHPKALCNLGVEYEKGNLVSRNLGKAKELYRKSAKKKSCWGMWNYARFVYHGYAMKADPKKAISFLKKNRQWIRIDASHADKDSQKISKLITKALKSGRIPS